MSPAPPEDVARPSSAKLADHHLVQLASLTEDLFCRAGPDGCILGLNPAWEELLGSSVDDLLGRPLLERVHPEDRDRTSRAFDRMRAGYPMRLFRNRFRRNDGGYCWLSWNAKADGDSGVVYAVARDVGHLEEEARRGRRAESEAAKARSMLESIRHVQRLAIVGADPATVFDFLLGAILEVAESSGGLLAELASDGESGPRLRVRAETNLARERGALEELEGQVYDRVVTTGTPHIVNRLDGDAATDLPEGHRAVSSFLGIPLRDDEGLVGLVSVTDRPEGFGEELVELLDPLCSTAARLIRAFGVRGERDRAEAELRRSEERWRRSVELAAYPVIVWNDRRVIRYANRAAGELLGIAPGEFVGMGLDRLLIEDDDPHEALRRMRRDGWSHRISYLRAANGDEVPVELQAVDLGDGTFQGMVFDMRDWVEIEERLKEASQRDNLTGLLNRRAIEEHCEVEIHRARRRASPLSVFMIDVDRFKHLNDLHGHLAGDAVLQAVAKVISANIRPYDWAGRWGGDELLVVLPGASGEQARPIAERVRTAIAAEPLELGNHGLVHVTVSIGIASSQTGATFSLLQYFERADAALYRAKRDGRNRVSD